MIAWFMSELMLMYHVLAIRSLRPVSVDPFAPMLVLRIVAPVDRRIAAGVEPRRAALSRHRWPP
jgi:hypothetical protein